MYLSKLNWGNIFVADPKNDEIVLNKKTRFTLVLIMLFALSAMAQDNITMNPGDINNDGVVDNKDALYLAEAFGSTGPARENASSDFYNEQTLPNTLWGESFYNGLNFAYADCNGDGIVNEADFYEGIVGNFKETVGLKYLDFFNPNHLPGSPGLIVDGDFNVIPGQQFINLELLVEADDPVEEFMGFVFTFEYNKFDKIAEIGFLPYNNSWLGNLQEDILYYAIQTDGFQSHRQQTHVALILKNELADGIGAVGQISIVMEDIVVGYNIPIDASNDVLIGDFVKPYYSYAMEDLIINPTQQPTSTQDVAWKSDLKAYPNPVGNQLNIQLDNPNIDIQNIEVLNANGQRLYEEQINYQSGALIQLDWSKYASGLYFLKITTSEGIVVRRLTK